MLWLFETWDGVEIFDSSQFKNCVPDKMDVFCVNFAFWSCGLDLINMLADNSVNYCAPSPIPKTVSSNVIRVKPLELCCIKASFFGSFLSCVAFNSVWGFLPYSNMWVISLPYLPHDTVYFFSHALKIDWVVCNIKFKFWVIRFIILVLHMAVVVDHAADVSMIYKYPTHYRSLVLPSAAKLLDVPDVFAT